MQLNLSHQFAAGLSKQISFKKKEGENLAILGKGISS